MASRSIAVIGEELSERRRSQTNASIRLVSRYLDVSEAKVNQIEQGEEFDGWREVARRYRTILPILEDQAQRDDRLVTLIQSISVDVSRWAFASAEGAINVLIEDGLITLPAAITPERLRLEIQHSTIQALGSHNREVADETEDNNAMEVAAPVRRLRVIAKAAAVTRDEDNDDDFIDSIRRTMDERDN